MLLNIFSQIFSNIDVLSIILLSVGAILFTIELFLPGFGFFGISGILFLIGGVVSRVFHGATIDSIVGLIILIFLFITLIICIILWSANHGLISKTPLIEKETAVPVNYNINQEYKKLLNKEGVITSDCRPVGTIMIGETEYEVFSATKYIDKGEFAKVVKVEGDKITVKKL